VQEQRPLSWGIIGLSGDERVTCDKIKKGFMNEIRKASKERTTSTGDDKGKHNGGAVSERQVVGRN
jgi:hypothetical protein